MMIDKFRVGRGNFTKFQNVPEWEHSKMANTGVW